MEDKQLEILTTELRALWYLLKAVEINTRPPQPLPRAEWPEPAEPVKIIIDEANAVDALRELRQEIRDVLKDGPNWRRNDIMNVVSELIENKIRQITGGGTEQEDGATT